MTTDCSTAPTRRGSSPRSRTSSRPTTGRRRSATDGPPHAHGDAPETPTETLTGADTAAADPPGGPLLVVRAGQVAYEQALGWQHLLVEAREAGDIGDVLITLEHPPVYTAGRRADVDAHVLATPATRDIPVVRVERGGDVTYHGPGQLVVYPILRLAHAKAVRPYVETLERAVVEVADSYGVTAAGATIDGLGGSPPRTGVWVGDEKLAAIGIKITGRTTSHGLAVNIDPDMAHFAGIVPCGIRDAGICSFASLGVRTDRDDVEGRLVARLADAVGRVTRKVTPAELGLG